MRSAAIQRRRAHFINSLWSSLLHPLTILFVLTLSACTTIKKDNFKLTDHVVMVDKMGELAGCATGHYTRLDNAGNNIVEQLKENLYQVEYQTDALLSQKQLDHYLRRRSVEEDHRSDRQTSPLSRRAHATSALPVSFCQNKQPESKTMLSNGAYTSRILHSDEGIQLRATRMPLTTIALDAGTRKGAMNLWTLLS